MSTGDWSTGLFECCEDPKTCVITYFCLGCQVAHQKAVLEKKECAPLDACMVMCCPMCMLYANRTAMMTIDGIHEGMCSTIMAVCCCALCGVSQQHRHLVKTDRKPAGCFMD
eukprot:NODE_1944_length_703_cov_205.787462_g1514_i0.p1 GENE.NODE_1944_length_703_cov_205.787462_g1514_i0~~NODE_1944_length_703_cov_205.787462_g1514_i0.p1  ORF type:complete len:131 (+),score=36.71 NODE_1944_length_703_cov_205.787462_g1514_i0:60-395(+)